MFEQDYIMRLVREIYDLLDEGSPNCMEVAILFYSYLNDKTDEFLKENDYSRAEIQYGIESVAERVGLSGLVNTIFIE